MSYISETGYRRGLALWHFYGIAAVFLVLLCLVPVWIKTALHEYHNYDLGIFAQALHSIDATNWNPFIPALNIRLFSDHFDPILILVSPLGHLLEPAYAALLVEHLLILITPLPLLIACRRDHRAMPLACFAVVYLFFNRGILSAIAFPVHPTTWASFFVMWAGVTGKQEKWGWLLLSSILLMACKEEFPFAVLMLAGGLAWKRHFKIGAILAALAVVWLILAFGIRPWILGDSHDYASRVLSPLLSNPIATLWSRLRNLGAAKHFLRSLLPLIPLAYWCLRHKLALDWTMLIFALPMLAIRFLDEAWGFHYLAPVMPLFLLLFWGRSIPHVPWKYAFIGIAITVLSGAGPIGKAVAVYDHVAELYGARRNSIEQARSYLLENKDGKAIVHGNLTPLLARRSDVFQIGGVQTNQTYRYYLAEKPPSGNPWPLSHSDIEGYIHDWRSRSDLIVLHDDIHVFFAEESESNRPP